MRCPLKYKPICYFLPPTVYTVDETKNDIKGLLEITCYGHKNVIFIEPHINWSGSSELLFVSLAPVIMAYNQKQDYDIKCEKQQYQCQYGNILHENVMMGTSATLWEQNYYHTAPFESCANYMNSSNGFCGTSGRVIPYNSEGYVGNYESTEAVYPSYCENYAGFYATNSCQYSTPSVYDNGNSCRYGHSNFPRFVCIFILRSF